MRVRTFFLLLLALGLGLGLGLAAPVIIARAGTQPAAISYVSAYTGFDFLPSRSAITVDNIGVKRWLTAPAGSYNLVARLDLPQGAQINSVTFYLIDNSTSQNIDLRLQCFTADGSLNGGILGNTNGLPVSANIQTTVLTADPAHPIIIDNNNAYYLEVNLKVYNVANVADHAIVGAKVSYSLPSAYLPIVER